MSNKQKKLESFINGNIEKVRLENGQISWKKLGKLILEEFPGENVHKERIRSIYRKSADPTYKKWHYKKQAVGSMAREEKSYKEAILSRINKKYSVAALADRLDIPEEDLLQEIVKLQFEGYAISLWQESGKRFVQLDLKNRKDAEPTEHFLNKTESKIKIAIFSDTHIGHKQSRKDKLNAFILEAYRQGIRDLFFAGDLVEGHYMAIRPTSIKELEAIGFDDQVELADETLPRLPGLTYHMISGNHDGSFTRNAFANPVKTLAKMRNDINYLGHNFAKVWLNDKVSIALIHPTDGIGQSYDLKMKQHIDRARPEKLARFIFMGHYHKFNHTHYKGVDGYIMPAFVGYSHFMDDKNLATIIGGIILTINLNKDQEVISFIPEYFFFDE